MHPEGTTGGEVGERGPRPFESGHPFVVRVERAVQAAEAVGIGGHQLPHSRDQSAGPEAECGDAPLEELRLWLTSSVRPPLGSVIMCQY